MRYLCIIHDLLYENILYKKQNISLSSRLMSMSFKIRRSYALYLEDWH